MPGKLYELRVLQILSTLQYEAYIREEEDCRQHSGELMPTNIYKYDLIQTSLLRVLYSCRQTSRYVFRAEFDRLLL